MSTGTKRVTADSAIGTSGKPVRVFAANWLSTGTAGVLVLRNGTSASGDIYLTMQGIVSQGQTFDIHDGMLFPSGCFYDHDSNTTYATITYSVERN